METNYKDKILNVQHLVEKYDLPAFACTQKFYAKHNIKPCLAVILTSADPGSVSYTKGIKKFCAANEIECKDFLVNSADNLSETIKMLNEDVITSYSIHYTKLYDVLQKCHYNI